MLADSIVVVDLLVSQQPTLTIIPNQDTSMVEFLIYITILKTFNIYKKFESRSQCNYKSLGDSRRRHRHSKRPKDEMEYS